LLICQKKFESSFVAWVNFNDTLEMDINQEKEAKRRLNFKYKTYERLKKISQQ
jgi:hypothetical protein